MTNDPSFIDGFPIATPFIGDFPLPCLNAGGICLGKLVGLMTHENGGLLLGFAFAKMFFFCKLGIPICKPPIMDSYSNGL